ncbi:MAG TPA: acyl-CoA reductase [Labilithrix sp.]|nr:acyl-CoA reductase [Labilithrix sp.]
MTPRHTAERVADVRRLQRAARAALADRAALVPAIVESTGLSPEGVELALDRHVEIEATDADLERLVERAGDAARVSVVLSANVFVGALRALALARAASTDVVVRPSRRDPAFARALVEAAIQGGDRWLRLDEALDVASVEVGEIHVYGRDDTIADVRRRARVRVRGHGSGMGVVWISRAAELDVVARGLAEDVVVFDQRGCLSPRIAFVEGDEARASALADALHAELERLATLVPRGALPAEERAAAGRYVATMTYACRALVGSQHAIGIAPPGAPLVLPPPWRHLHVAASGSIEEAARLLAPLARGVVTLGSDDLAAARRLAPPWARLAAIGRLQRPPLDGPVDLRDSG